MLRLAQSSLAFAQSLSPLELVGMATTTCVGYALLQLARVWFSDCDLAVAAAARRMPAFAFEGKVVWIVGASSGIGEALAYELASRGAHLVLSARRVDVLAAMIDKCHRLGAPVVHVQRLDVTALDSHAPVVDAVYRRFPKVDILVNNAGRSQRGLAESTPLSVDVDMFALNVHGAVGVAKAVLPRMLSQVGGGTIAFTSSIAGKVGSPISATYASTKHAVQGWADSLRMEVASRGVRVVSVCPGPVESEITLHAYTDKPGTELGVKADGSNRMSAERCAHLYAAALWAGLPEVWMAPQPILLFVYIGQYARDLYFYLGPRKVGPARVEAFKAGQSGYGAVQSLGGLLSGGPRDGGESSPAAKKAL